MAFDFDTVVERRDTGSTKWSKYGNDVLPFWIADMDFLSPEPVIRAMQARVAQGHFGYMFDCPELVETIQDYLHNRQQWTVEKDQIRSLPGLVSALHAVCRIINDGDGIVMTTPIYQPFLDAAKRSGRALSTANLQAIRTGQILRYEIDFDALEKAITPQTRLLLFCNPHNPIGRVYTQAELEKIADRCITLLAPSKTYNLPGLGCSIAVIQNPDLAKRVTTVTEGIVPHVNILGYTAALAAYREGRPWLEALLVYLRANRDYLVDYVTSHWPAVGLTCPEGTYLTWLDFTALNLEPTAFEFFLKEAKVALTDGLPYASQTPGFVRLNFGCPRSLLVAGLQQMDQALSQRT